MKIYFHRHENKFSWYGNLFFMPERFAFYAIRAAMNWIKRIRNTIAIG